MSLDKLFIDIMIFNVDVKYDAEQELFIFTHDPLRKKHVSSGGLFYPCP